MIAGEQHADKPAGARGARFVPTKRAGAERSPPAGQAPDLVLAIEVSNPSSGVERPAAEVALAPLLADGTPDAGAALVEPVRQGKGEDDLIPAVARAFERAGAERARLRAIAVDVGPGGYTGLRVAVSVVKLLAEATGARIVAVPAWAVATTGVDWPEDAGAALVCLASKGERTHATLVRRGSGGGGSGDEVGMVSAADMPRLRPPLIVADRFLPAAIRSWADSEGVTVVPLGLGAAGLLGCFPEWPAVDPLALAPLYAREPDAVTQWRARHGSAPGDA